MFMLREIVYWQDALFRLESISVYRKILQDDVLKSFRVLLRTMAYDKAMTDSDNKYYDFLHTLTAKAHKLGLKGNIFRKYLIYLFLLDENIFTVSCERNIPVESTSVYNFVMKDIAVLTFFFDFDIKNLCENIGYGEDITQFKSINPKEEPYLEEIENAKTMEQKAAALMWYYRRIGAGEMSLYTMFTVNDETGALDGVRNPDPVVMADIIGCAQQKEILLKNTQAFLAGEPANNVLLAGSRGTGKSSCVKALVNEFNDRGLRLIEIYKDNAKMLPKLINRLAERGKFFIIFMDDLSYEHFETQYKYLKSLLEGGAAARPANVLFYATSNRRHIVHETFAERDGEIHPADAQNEKMSLHDRFGLNVYFPNATQDDYVNIVIGLAKRNKISIDNDFLKKQALQWAMEHRNQSGRTAVQFIHHIMWELKHSI
jgi:hypothetical protein